MKHKGIICGILAAVCYGTNPLGEYVVRPFLSLFYSYGNTGCCPYC